MPINQNTNFIPVRTSINPGSLTMTPSYAGKMTWVETDSAIDFTLSSAVSFGGNSEIIIRNSSSSLAAITIVASGVTLDVSADLGAVIPIGGIGELKRIGSSSVWAFYGYIEA